MSAEIKVIRLMTLAAELAAALRGPDGADCSGIYPELVSLLEQVSEGAEGAPALGPIALAYIRGDEGEDVVSNVQVFPIQQGGKTKAMARVLLWDSMQLTGIRVVEGANGLFVSYPNDPAYKGDDYRSLYYPLTKELREKIEEAVLSRYREAKKEEAG